MSNEEVNNNSEVNQGFGKADYVNNGKAASKTVVPVNYWNLVQGGHVIRRILPPMKKFAQSGQWRYYDVIHWGYAGHAFGNTENKLKARPFRCIQRKNGKTGEIYQECPEDTRTNQVKEQLESILADAKVKKNKTEEELAVLTGPLQEYLNIHKTQKRWVLAAKSPDGQFGLLRIPHRSLGNLLLKIEELAKDGIDPLSLDAGVWFDFQLVGKGSDSKHPVDIVMEGTKATGQKLKFDTLSAAEVEQALKLPELDGNSRVLTFEQIKSLVSSGGEPDIVDKVFALPRTDTDFPSKDDDDNEDLETAPTNSSDSPSSVAAAVSNVSDMSAEEFMKVFGAQVKATLGK